MKPIIRASMAATLLALSFQLAGCGTPASLPAVSQPAAPAFSESGPNVIDLKQANGGKLEVSLQMPTQRKVLAFAEDVKELKGTLYMDEYNKVDFTLKADEYGKAKVSFLNLKPGTWKLSVNAYDRGYQDVGYAVAENIYVRPYEISYEALTVYLKDTNLNKDTGAMQAAIDVESGDLKQEYVAYPQVVEGYLPDAKVAKVFEADMFYGHYTAFNTYGAKGTWEGDVTFGFYKFGDVVYLTAVLDNGKRKHPLAKAVISVDGYPDLTTDFVDLKKLNLKSFELASVAKAPDTEYIVTGKHKEPVKVQRYLVIDPEKGEHNKPVGLMTSLFFAVGEDGKLGGLIAADFTDQGGQVGSDPSPDGYKPNFNVVHIQALDK